MADAFPSHYRILLFVAVLGGLCLLDLPKPAAERTRFRQYGFILLLGVGGAVFGLINDTLTATLSPDYFVYAKGIPLNEAFMRNVWWLGGQAGFGAFVFLGVILMILNPFKPDMRPVAMRLWIPLCFAIFFGVVCASLQAVGLFFRPMSPPISDHFALNRFQIVWAIHAGLYVGGVLGVAVLCMKLFTAKRKEVSVLEDVDR